MEAITEYLFSLITSLGPVWVSIITLVFGVVAPLIEAWLGKTKTVKSNSILALIADVLLSIIKSLLKLFKLGK